MDIKGSVIVITGAAQGLGLAMVQDLAASGAKLALIDLHQQSLQQAAQQIPEAQVSIHCCNVTDERQVEQTFTEIADRYGQLNGIVNNAGILRDGMFIKVKHGEVTSKMSLEQFQSVIDVNLSGVFLCGREAGVQMIKTKSKGVIINMSSVARAGNIGQTNYAASKAGVVAITTTWARELGRFGIRVGAIAPGVIRTAMTDSMKPEAIQRLEQAKPVGRLGNAKEIAHAAKFIFENDFFTGRVLEVDGGITF